MGMKRSRTKWLQRKPHLERYSERQRKKVGIRACRLSRGRPGLGKLRQKYPGKKRKPRPPERFLRRMESEAQPAERGTKERRQPGRMGEMEALLWAPPM